MKKTFLILSIAAVLVCLLAVSVSAANIYYKNEAGETIFTGVDENSDRVFESYEGSFPNTDASGNALTWYITSTETVGEDTVHNVASFQTIDTSGVHAALSEDGVYKYIDQNKELAIVSAFFPDNANILKLSLSNDGYAIKYVFVDEKQSNLLFLRVPNTLTELPSRIVQATQIIDFSASDDALYPSLSPTCFYDCQNMRSVDIPKNVTIFYSNGHSNNGHTFYRCVNLTDVYFAPDSRLETIQHYAFSNCRALKEITIPNSVVSLGSQVFWDCFSLETVRLGANQGKGLDEYNVQSMLYGCKALKYVYVSDTLIPTAGSHLFYSGANGMVFFYTGTYEQYEALNAILKTLGNNGKFTGATPIEWNSINDDQFYKNLATNDNKNYVVYGYGRCDAFYGGHKMSADAQMQLTSYFDDIKFASVCTNEGCNHAGYDETKTIGAIFVDYGYSMTENEIGGKLSMSQFFGIDKANLEKYTALTNESFEFGFVVSSNADPMNEANSDLIAQGKTYVTTQSKIKHDYFEIKVSGFTDANSNSDLAFCVYVGFALCNQITICFIHRVCI